MVAPSAQIVVLLVAKIQLACTVLHVSDEIASDWMNLPGLGITSFL